MIETVDTGDGWGAPSEVSPDTEVRIRTEDGSVVVLAYVFGAWAVHRARPISGCNPQPHPESWAVSHVPSAKSIGHAVELDFWEAVRIARALEDTGVFRGTDLSESDGWWIFEAAVGAALHDHYVWPLPLGGWP